MEIGVQKQHHLIDTIQYVTIFLILNLQETIFFHVKQHEQGNVITVVIESYGSTGDQRTQVFFEDWPGHQRGEGQGTPYH